MDPNKALEELRRLIRVALEDEWTEEDAISMAEQFQAIDEWLTRGGFLPEEWDHEQES